MKPRIAISIGDLNGIGAEIALKSHTQISTLCHPFYCISDDMLQQSAGLLKMKIPASFETVDVDGHFSIEPGLVSKESGLYSYKSFMKAISLAESNAVDAITTMPIHKEAWALAGLTYKGHTDLLRRHFNKDAIMMLGCESLYVALYTEHIPLKQVPDFITENKLSAFLLDLNRELGDYPVAVLGLNPHAGDNGVLGNEELAISAAIEKANKIIGEKIFTGPVVPDIAFTPDFRKKYTYMVAMYHDQGLGPLKALYFDESINVSLNLPIIRTSVDHGTAFDIAYTGQAKTLSYINAIKAALSLIENRTPLNY